MSVPSKRSLPRVRRSGVVLAMAVALGLAFSVAPVVVGHALLVATDPADGATLVDPPSRMSLEFTETIIAVEGGFELVASDGRRIVLVREPPEGGDLATLTLQVPQLEPDIYRLRWRALSSVDLHVVSGTLVFGVGMPAGASTAEAETAASPVEVGMRWLDVLAFSVLVGALALLVGGLPRTQAVGDGAEAAVIARIRDRLIRLGVIAATVALAVGHARLVGLVLSIDEAAGPSEVAAVVSDSTFGGIWIARELAVLGGVVALTGALLMKRRTATLVLVATGYIVGAATLQAATGHLAARIGAPAAIPIGLVHIVAAGVWVGGVVALTLAVMPIARMDDAGRRYARRVLGRFGRLAAVALVGLAVSGLLLMGNLVATPDALVGSAYGTSLMLKTAIVAGVALLGLLNASTLHRSLRLLLARVVPTGLGVWVVRHGVSRSIRAEAVGGLAVIGLAALVASMPPARGPAWDPLPADAVTTPVAGAAADLLITVDVRPNRPGRNFVSLRIVDTRRPALAQIAAVTLRLVAPDGGVSDAVVSPLGRGQFEATPTLLRDGRWGATVTVARMGLPDAAFETPWTVLPAGVAGGERRVQVSDVRLEPVLTPLAAALGVGAVTIGLMLITERILGRSGRGRSRAAPLNLKTRSVDG